MSSRCRTGATSVEDWSDLEEDGRGGPGHGHNAGGLECDVNIRGFIPISQIALYRG